MKGGLVKTAMDDKEIIKIKDTTLLDIFTSEEDRKGTDLLAMSNYFDVFIGKISAEVGEYSGWELYDDVSSMLGQIATAIKGGFDISKLGMLVADTSHFSQEIVDGLKSGLYHIGQSKEVAGNLRPAVLDSKEHLIKFVTLKKAIDPSVILEDISNLTIQASLKQINAQIEDVGRDVKSIGEFVRRETLSNKFLCARDKIMSAASANDAERKKYLYEADTYLMEGLTSLYSDLNSETSKLAGLSGPFRSLKEADAILTHINEDMQMIPRYVGLRVYLLNYCGNIADAHRVISDYRYQLDTMFMRKIGQGKYSALEEIHRYYPYREDNIDFWIEKPKQMVLILASYEKFFEAKEAEIFYIDADAEALIDE